jgi:hypothetical protein
MIVGHFKVQSRLTAKVISKVKASIQSFIADVKAAFSFDFGAPVLA